MGAGRILVADIDGTLHGDDVALARFAAWFHANTARYRLVYSTGRHLESVDSLIRDTDLPAPDAVISAVGTEIHDRDRRPWPGWEERLAGWDAADARRVLRPKNRLELQPAAAQTARKASYDVRGLTRADLEAIDRELRAAGLPSTLVYSADRYLDVLPAAGGKGHAARFVADAWHVEPHDVLVFGDSGNDLQMFEQGFRGTLVANALPELVGRVGDDAYRSPHAFAGGVLDGVRYWSAR